MTRQRPSHSTGLHASYTPKTSGTPTHLRSCTPIFPLPPCRLRDYYLHQALVRLELVELVLDVLLSLLQPFLLLHQHFL